MKIEHNFDFDPTNGKTLEELLQIKPGTPPGASKISGAVITGR